MMSKGLCLAAVPATSQRASDAAASDIFAQPFIHVLLSIGLCVLVVWIVRRLANPAKLSLRSSPGRPNDLRPGHMILMLAAYLSPITVLSLVTRGQPGGRLSLTAQVIAQLLLLSLGLALARTRFRYGLRRGLGLSMRHWIYDTARGVLGYLAILPVCVGLVWVVSWFAGRSEQDLHPLLSLAGEVGFIWQVLIVLSAAVLAPAAEEIFFRGLLQSMFTRYLASKWLAIALTSVFFTLMHIGQWKDMPALFALSVALGYNYERCGRLWPSMLLHGLFNAVNVAVKLAAG